MILCIQQKGTALTQFLFRCLSLMYNFFRNVMREDTSMEQQVLYQERPRASTGGKVFLVLEMVAVIFAELSAFISRLFLSDASSSIPIVTVLFWIVFFVYIAGYILLLIGTSSRNNIGVLIAGFSIFLLLEWESFITNFTSISAFAVRLSRLSALNATILYTFTFVWISLIILTCIKKAPKALCLIPGLIGIIASILNLYSKLIEISMWESISGISDGKEVASMIFVRIAGIIWLFVVLFRPFWIFMVSHWLTHPTYKVAVRQGFRPITPQPVQPYVPAQPYQPYQAVPQGYQQMPPQGYQPYQQPQQPPRYQ